METFMNGLASLHQLAAGEKGAYFHTSKKFRLKRTIMEEVVEKRPWCDLPTELLQKIAGELVLTELLTFRSVCKDWRSASSYAIAKINSEEHGLHPWFLLCGDGPRCSLHDPSSGNVYTSCIPELESSSCLASNNGWLLVHRKELLFFFCPFSRAKIDLPMLVCEAETGNHFAAFSGAPTSPACVVCIGNCRSEKIEVNVLTRGAVQWAKHKLTSNGRLCIGRYTLVTFREEILYIVSRPEVLTFSLKDQELVDYRIVPNDHPASKNVKTLPIIGKSRNPTLNEETREKMGLEEGDSISTCGTVLEFGRNFSNCIWHDSGEAQEVNEANKGKDICHKKGVWVHPRFFQLPTDQSWSL